MALNMFAPQQSNTNKPLVEFRAGKMTQNAQTKLVTADKRKGLVQLTQSPDSLLHFIWKDRTTGAVEDDLIIFPEEAVYKRAKDRAFVLEFKDSSRKLFFWMQEPKDDKDEEYLSKINQHINNPPTMDAMDEMDENPSPNNEGINQSILNQMLQASSQQQQQQSRPTTTPAPSTTTTTNTTAAPTPAPASSTTSSSANPNQVNISNLSSILGSMLQQHMPEQSPSYLLGIALPYIFQSDLLLPVLTHEMQESLVTDLPEGIRSIHEVTQTILSPQFQQAIQTFSYALQTGQLNYIIGQLGTDQAELLKNLQSFAQHHASRQKQRKEKGDKMEL